MRRARAGAARPAARHARGGARQGRRRALARPVGRRDHKRVAEERKKLARVADAVCVDDDVVERCVDDDAATKHKFRTNGELAMEALLCTCQQRSAPRSNRRRRRDAPTAAAAAGSPSAASSSAESPGASPAPSPSLLRRPPKQPRLI